MLVMEDARKKFASAASNIGNSDSLEVAFYHRVAAFLPEIVDIDTLILAIELALKDYKVNEIGTANIIALPPLFVRQCSSKEFAHEFRKRYNEEVLGLTQEELPDVDYGYTEIEEDVIDISDKDPCEVLAALYNASTPVGMGFAQYNKMTWTKEIAEKYFEINGGYPDKIDFVTFKWIMGRPVSCTFDGNLLYVEKYNSDNEWGLAQKAVATCPSYPTLRKKDTK